MEEDHLEDLDIDGRIISHTLHGTQYTPQLEIHFTNIAEHLTT
jgi:hypothetical protein